MLDVKQSLDDITYSLWKSTRD